MDIQSLRCQNTKKDLDAVTISTHQIIYSVHAGSYWRIYFPQQQ